MSDWSMRHDVTGILLGRKPVLRFVRVWFALTVVIGSVACRQARDTRAESRALHDDYGDAVVIGAPPRRIVSLNPTTTEILFTIGASDRLVGRSSWDIWPKAALQVPALGNAIRPNVEAVLNVHPDLVILYASLDNRPAAQRLRAAGIQTLSLKVDRIAQFDSATRLIGRVVGDSARAAFVADTVMRTLQRVRAATQNLPHPTVVWPYAYRPPMVVGGGSFLDELLKIAGAVNLYSNLPLPSPSVTIEDIVQKNPQYVLRSADPAQSGQLPTAWNAIPAVSAGHILTTRTSIVARPSVQLGEAAVEIANVLHPDLHLK
jgi:ABC-type Fe3+-hydroxamate transport system substrate-binding protein